MSLAAIDPGTTQSALVVWDGKKIEAAVIWPNEKLVEWLRSPPALDLCIEQVAAMGMSVGEEVFTTVWWAGRFAEANYAKGGRVEMVKRMKVKMHLCGNSRAKDGNIRQALIDRLGAPGKKKAPGPTFGVVADQWQALALAVTVWDERAKEIEPPF